MNKVIDVTQKYEKPITQKLRIVEEVARITQIKEFKKSFNSSKYRSEESPNCRQVLKWL
jgi:hypothetical protein